MSDRSDFIKKVLEPLGAKREGPGGRHILWRIGTRLFPLPTVFNGRKFQNYEAQARRIAAEEGLLPKRSMSPVVQKEKHRHARSGNSAPESVEEATPEEVRGWQLRNILEEFARKRELMEGAKVEETRTPLKESDRIPLIDRAIREAGKPLSAKEICARIPGWDTENDRRMTLRVLKNNPARYKATRGTMRGEHYELVPPQAAPAPAAGEATATATVPGTGIESSATPRLKPTSDAGHILNLIQEALDGFKPESDPKEAVYLLGQIRGLLRVL